MAAGVNNARRVECKKSKFHGHHPENEACPNCDPQAYEAYEVVYDQLLRWYTRKRT